MHYEKLLQVTSQYGAYGYDEAYTWAMQELQWHGPQFNIANNIGVIEEFLRKWRSVRGGLPDRGDLAAVWMEDIEPYAGALESETVEEYNADKVIAAGSEHLRVGMALEHMFGALLQIPTIGATNASKILHLRLPNLVVMTDGEVRRLWCEMHSEIMHAKLFDPYCYAFKFHGYIHGELTEAIVTLCSDKRLSRDEAVDFLRNAHGRQRSLAKLADEYYYMMTR